MSKNKGAFFEEQAFL